MTLRYRATNPPGFTRTFRLPIRVIQPAGSTEFCAIQGIVTEHKVKCDVCGGSGQCTMCKGTSNGGQCTNCAGKGQCPQCEGTGHREPDREK
jgi:hypothetical protein